MRLAADLRDIADQLETLADDARQEGRAEVLRGLFSRLEARERGAALPSPLYAGTMTLEEVRAMIERERDGR